MPSKTKQNATASRSRKSIDRRKNKKGQGRQGIGQPEAPSPRVIANSFFALTLKPKPGIEINDKIQGKSSRRLRQYGEDDYYQMYNDLLPAFHKAVLFTTGQKTGYDPLSYGLGIGSSLHSIVAAFKKEFVPNGFDLDVDYSEQEGLYYFSINSYCQFNNYWHAFEIKPVVEHYRKTNRRLHDLFIQFIHFFSSRAGICCWWNGAMGYAEYYCQEKLDDWENHVELDDEDPAALEKCLDDQLALLKTIDIYERGPAKYYENLIKKAPVTSLVQLEKKISAYSRKIPIVDFMLKACEFMKLPGCMGDFDKGGEEFQEGLEYNQQVSIVWDWDDPYTAEEMDCMDSTANGVGVIPPVLNYPVTKFIKEFKTDQLSDRVKWPSKLSALHGQYVEMVKKIKPKTKNERKN